jgi:hypothetical protein
MEDVNNYLINFLTIWRFIAKFYVNVPNEILLLYSYYDICLKTIPDQETAKYGIASKI